MKDQLRPPHHPPPKDSDVTLTPETIELIEERMAAAVRAGIDAALTEEMAVLFWGAGVKVLQRQASEHTGRFVIGGLWGLMRRAGVFVLLGALVYSFGGWTSLAKFWHLIWSGGGGA